VQSPTGSDHPIRRFMQTRIEPLVDARTHKFDADDVVAALLDEFHRRTERNMALLKGFFRQGAGGAGGDSDVCTTYDEFLEVGAVQLLHLVYHSRCI
jgi:hypothetical protein